MTGRIVSVSKSGFHVNIDGKTEFCLINNSFKDEVRPIVNDEIEVVKREDKYFIVNVRQRRNVFGRWDEYKKRHQYFAANIDVVFIVTSANREFSQSRVKRFIALCAAQGIKAVLVLTKVDKSTKSCQIKIDKLIKDDIGADAEIIKVNALDINDVKKLFEHWKSKETAMLVGSSGVGKSTIINTLCNLNLKTSEVQSERLLNKGRHTTSARTVYTLGDGRRIIDNPGIRIVGVQDIDENV